MRRQQTRLRHHHAHDPEGFVKWAARANRGEFSVYHIGNLAADRLTDPAVEELACLVLLLAECSWVNAMQTRKSVAHQFDYLAVRTGAGFMPRSIASRAITATDYRVLNGLLDYSRTPGAISMQRAIRAMLPTSSEDAAQSLFKRFSADGWIEPRDDTMRNGWQISGAGMQMLR